MQLTFALLPQTAHWPSAKQGRKGTRTPEVPTDPQAEKAGRKEGFKESAAIRHFHFQSSEFICTLGLRKKLC